ncbi:MAG TPA: MFS transporter, partial [Vicinamibacterales bacterium]|nr:MFS transporter [Vicinamibacterales bacterium]
MPSDRQWTLVATIIGSSMTFVDATVVNVALPALQAELHATITDVQWVIEAYALLLGGLILVGGSLGDQFGRKRVFLGGVWLFTLASVACGLATSTQALVVARAVQGIGAAFLMPGSLAIISATFDDAERGRAIGTWSGFGAITSAAGPIVGGWLIEHVSWRAAFFINVPLAAVVIALSIRFMNESRDDSRGSRVDWIGAALAVVGLGALVFSLLEWPERGDHTFTTLGALAIGVASLAALMVVERRVPAPMLPLGLFTSRTFTLSNVLTLFVYGALAVVLWLVPLDLIQGQHYSATAAGAAFLPFPLLMFVLSRWSGGLVVRVGSRLPLTLGPVVVAAGLALFAPAARGGSYWTTMFPAVAVTGLGMAIVVAPLTTTVMSAVEVQHAGVASGVNNAVARIAGLVAIAAVGVVLIRSFDVRVGTALDALALPPTVRAAIDRELPKLAGANVAVVAGNWRDAARRAIDESFTASFRVVMTVIAGLAFVGAIAGALLQPDTTSPN